MCATVKTPHHNHHHCPHTKKNPWILVKHGESHECWMAILAVFTLTSLILFLSPERTRERSLHFPSWDNREHHITVLTAPVTDWDVIELQQRRSAVSCSLLALPRTHENAFALPGKLKYVKRTESKNVKFKFFLFCMRCLPQTEPSSFKANQRIYSTSVLHHHHSSYLEKWQACILSYEIFISCEGEEKDSALNFSLFCLNQTMLAWQERENWVAIQISWKINYSSVPLSFFFWTVERNYPPIREIHHLSKQQQCFLSQVNERIWKFIITFK